VFAVFISAGTMIQLCAGGGGGQGRTCAIEVRRAEECVDERVHHALVNAREREIV